MLSKKAKYAIKVLIVLGKDHHGSDFVHVSKILAAERIPKKSLESVLSALITSGYLQNRKGALAGYKLRLSPEEITIDKIVRLIDGPIARISCASIFHYHKCEECNEETCSIRELFVAIREADFKLLSGTSVADLIKKEELLSTETSLRLKD